MLVIEKASKTFFPGTVNEKKALVDINLTVQDGDFITLLGSNGAGKSTLLNAIGGNLIVDTGKITLDGKNLTFIPAYKRAKYIGRLFQDPLMGTAPAMTIAENLALAYLRANTFTSPFSMISRKDKDAFQDALKQLDMGLEDRMNAPVGTLSGGQRQALTLLMATIVTPKILLLDEHTAALDPLSASKVMALTKQIVLDHRITCFMVTHNMKQAIETGNRILLMSQGTIVKDIENHHDLQVQDLMTMFQEATHQMLDNDRMMLEEG